MIIKKPNEKYHITTTGLVWVFDEIRKKITELDKSYLMETIGSKTEFFRDFGKANKKIKLSNYSYLIELRLCKEKKSRLQIAFFC